MLKDEFYIGRIIGDFTILNHMFKHNGTLVLECKCNICGKVKTIYASDIKRQPNSILHKSCLRCKRYNIGDIVNDMRILNVYSEDGTVFYDCECIICGNKKRIRKYHLNNSPYVASHSYCNYFCTTGLAINNSRLHRIWKNMKSRIYNPNNTDYYNYGGRGLTTDYDKFDDFYNDLHESYYEHVNEYGENNTTIDRIDNDLGYTKGNIRWATYQTQARNRRVMIGNIFYAFSPDGNLYFSNNISAFSKNHCLTPSKVSLCLSGQRNTHKNWIFQRYTENPQLLLFTPQNVIEEFYY